MIRVVLLAMLAGIAAPPAMAQRDSTRMRPALVAEAMGPGGYGSINHEQPIARAGVVVLRLRAGVGALRFRDFTGRFNPDLTLPVGLLLTLERHWSPELGVGFVLTSTVRPGPEDYRPKRMQDLHGWLSAGLRWAPRQDRWFLRAAYDPVIDFGRWRHWGALSFGWIL